MSDLFAVRPQIGNATSLLLCWFAVVCNVRVHTIALATVDIGDARGNEHPIESIKVDVPTALNAVCG